MNHVLGNSNMLICKALVKYGYYSLRLEILENCEANTRIKRKSLYLNYYVYEVIFTTIIRSEIINTGRGKQIIN